MSSVVRAGLLQNRPAKDLLDQTCDLQTGYKVFHQGHGHVGVCGGKRSTRDLGGECSEKESWLLPGTRQA